MAEYIKRGDEQADAVTREIKDTVSEILSAVQREGEAAVRRYSGALDDWQPDRFTVGRDEIDRAYASVDDELAEHIERARAQVQAFAELQRQTMLDLEVETLPGVILGHKHVPVEAVGPTSRSKP
jgi:Histidinol dehydrogenase